MPLVGHASQTAPPPPPLGAALKDEKALLHPIVPRRGGWQPPCHQESPTVTAARWSSQRTSAFGSCAPQTARASESAPAAPDCRGAGNDGV
jgi:hypothetical protein